MHKSFYWSTFLYKKLLDRYQQLKVVRLALHKEAYFKEQILKNFKQHFLGAFNNELVNFILPAKSHLINIVRPFLMRPSLREIVCGQFMKQANHPYLLNPPRLVVDFHVRSLELETYVNFFYLHRLLVCCLSRLQNFIVIYLQFWLSGDIEKFSEELLFSLFAKQLFLLSKLGGCQLELDSNSQSHVFSKPATPIINKVVKKKKKVLNYPSPEIMRFLINLIKISSRAGGRLRNFKHFMLFLRKLRVIGGYSRLKRVLVNLNPFFYFRKRYRGRRSFFVPFVILPEVRYKFIGRSLLSSVIQRKTERGFSQQLFMEIVDALRKRGRTYRHKTYALSFTNMQKFNVRKSRRPRNRFLRRRVFY